MSKKIDILGVRVDDISRDEATANILRLAKARSRGNYVVTVNSEFVMMARRNRDFARILASSDLALADGQWVVISKLILGCKAHDRITGVDLVENLCRKVANRPITIGFLGGFGDVATRVAKRQKKLSDGLKVVFTAACDPTIGSDLRLKALLDKAGRIDILFVAFGMGRQELWIERMRKSVNVGVYIGVGGAFDYLAGVKKRAPRLLQVWGLEWLWRLALEPSRVWRMRVLPAFFGLMLINLLKRQILTSSK